MSSLLFAFSFWFCLLFCALRLYTHFLHSFFGDPMVPRATLVPKKWVVDPVDGCIGGREAG